MQRKAFYIINYDGHFSLGCIFHLIFLYFAFKNFFAGFILLEWIVFVSATCILIKKKMWSQII